MFEVSLLLAEVEEILAKERRSMPSVERVIERVLDAHGISDPNERVRLSADISLEHINCASRRARIAQADRRHEPRRIIEERMRLL